MRVCPNCKKDLGSYDNYFCSACGSVLPSDQINSTVSFKRVITIEEEPDKIAQLVKALKESLSKFWEISKAKDYLPIILLIVIAAVPMYFWTEFVFFAGKNANAKENSAPGYNIANVRTIVTPYSGGVFAPDLLGNYAPFESDVYIEAHDFDAIGSTYAMYDSAYSQLVSSLKDKLMPNFAVFAVKQDDNYVWGALLVLRDSNFDESKLDLTNYPWLKVKKVGRVLVISTAQNVVDEVNASHNETEKNLNLYPDFISNKAKLPLQGRVMMMALTPNGAAYLKSLVNLDLPDNFKHLLNSFVQSKQSSMVFL